MNGMVTTVETKKSKDNDHLLKRLREIRWKTKGLLFLLYLSIVTIPSIVISIECLYANPIFGIIEVPNFFYNIILFSLFLANAIIGVYLVSNYIIKMAVDKMLDAVSLVFSLLVAFWWNYDFQNRKMIYKAVTSTKPYNLMIMVLGLFLIMLSLLLLSRPKFRMGFFIQTAGITIFANSFLYYLRLIEIPGYQFYLIFVIILSVLIFGYSIYYRVKLEYNIDKNY